MNLNIDSEWLFQMAEKEDNCIISAGGYWERIRREQEIQDAIVLAKLEENPISVADTTKLFQDNGVANPEVTGKETSWRLVKQGIARFNDEWLLELNDD